MSSGHFEIHRAKDAGPIVVEVPHAGVLVDEEAAKVTRIPPRAVARGALFEDADLGADVLWEGTESLGVTRVVARASRYVVDLNTDPRPPPQPPFYDVGLQPRAFIRRSQCGVSWREELSVVELERRIRDVVEPYHEAVDTELETAKARHGFAFLLSSHTFQDRSRAIADVVLGTQDGACANRDLRDGVAEIFREARLSVAVESPFPGGWSLTRHVRPERGIQGMQIEFARRLITGKSDGGGTPSDESIAKLKGLLANAVELIRGYRA